jgi:hypothetical protein
MSYNELLQKYPKFYYSGKQFSELKKQSSAILKYFGTDEAKALMPDNQASPNFWMGTFFSLFTGRCHESITIINKKPTQNIHYTYSI